MQKAVRIGAVAVAVGLVGYAAFSLSRREPTSKTAATDTDDAPTKRVRADPAKSRETVAKRTAQEQKTREGKAGAANVGGPVVEEDVDFEKALDDLEAFVKDLESMKERGIKVPQPEWVEKYRRGNDLVDVLMRTEEVRRNDAPRKEVNALNMRFRAIIQDVLMTPAPPD